MKFLSLFFCSFALTVATPLHAQMRGAWCASVHNLNFPSSPGLSAAQQRAEIITMLDTAQKCGLNAILFQVRPESDALYSSRIEPWSRYLTGKQGTSPGYDPLAFCIAQGRKRGIAVHAWLNPYRAVASAGKEVAANHISRRYPQYAYRVGSTIIMDPGAPEIQAHILAVVRDILSRYDVAGIHFDDYFYPYPNNGKVPHFPDDKTFAAYRAAGGKHADKGAWRRASVTSLIARTYQLVHAIKPEAKFGVSPFGIYASGVPAGIKAGVDQRNHLFCDSLTWLKMGIVDYLAPQLYWKDGGEQSFSTLLRWWRSSRANPRAIPIVPGIAIERLNSQRWPVTEISKQIQIERSTSRAAGFLLWDMRTLRRNTKGVQSVFTR